MKVKIATLFIVVFLAILAAFYDSITTPTGKIIDHDNTIVSTRNDNTENINKAPDIGFTTIDGKKTTLSELKGRGVLLNFWASWCSTCIVEFPDLIRLVKDFNGKLALVAISIDDNKGDTIRFINTMKAKFPDIQENKNIYLVWDGDKKISLDTFYTTKVPETVLIDTQGNMIDKIVGEYSWNSEESRKKIEKLTNTPQ